MPRIANPACWAGVLLLTLGVENSLAQMEYLKDDAGRFSVEIPNRFVELPRDAIEYQTYDYFYVRNHWGSTQREFSLGFRFIKRTKGPKKTQSGASSAKVPRRTFRVRSQGAILEVREYYFLEKGVRTLQLKVRVPMAQGTLLTHMMCLPGQRLHAEILMKDIIKSIYGIRVSVTVDTPTRTHAQSQFIPVFIFLVFILVVIVGAFVVLGTFTNSSIVLTVASLFSLVSLLLVSQGGPPGWFIAKVFLVIAAPVGSIVGGIMSSGEHKAKESKEYISPYSKNAL